MSRPLLVLIVAMVGYGVLSTLVAAGVAALWRLRRSRVHSATTLAFLRLLPAGFGAFGTAAIVVPSFLIFEPIRDYEPVGPFALVAALVSLVIVGAAAFTALRALRQTVRLERRWLRSATRMTSGRPWEVTTYVIDSATPLVALIGVFSPRLVAARTVVEACTAEEFAVIVAHEQGHLRARDNLKRWLLDCAPDALRWTPVHGEIMQAWRDAAEDAADDAAAHDAPEARASLAALLVKVARLTGDVGAPAAVSAFADASGLERRVRRLLSDTATCERAGRFERAALVAACATAALSLSQPALLRGIYDLIEISIRLGR